MEVRLNNPDGKLLGTYNLNGKMKKFDFPSQKSPVDLCFVFKGIGESLLVLDSFEFK